jgi:phosphocarrier protein
MVEESFVIKNRLGLHARAAAILVKEASRFVSDVTIEKNGTEVDGKSIMGVLMLAAPKGTTISVKICGEDEKEAFSALKDLINDGFGED